MKLKDLDKVCGIAEELEGTQMGLNLVVEQFQHIKYRDQNQMSNINSQMLKDDTVDQINALIKKDLEDQRREYCDRLQELGVESDLTFI